MQPCGRALLAVGLRASGRVELRDQRDANSEAGDEPNPPVNDLAIVKGRMYAATDVGVFSSAVAKPRWFAFGSGMPQLVTTDLLYVPKAKPLFVATFGMGVWSAKA